MKHNKSTQLLGALLVCSGALTVYAHDDAADSHESRVLRSMFDHAVRYSQVVDFPQTIGAAGNVDRGRADFGLNATETAIDTSGGLFEGPSQVYGGEVHGNGKVCATCHLPEFEYGLPPDNAGLHARFPNPGDPVYNLAPEDGADPLGPVIFEQHQLLITRIGRFNPLRPATDPVRTSISWRKSQHLRNVVFTFGTLNDGRTRNLIEQGRAAIFNHTQNTDTRFDDVSNMNIDGAHDGSNQRIKDIAAYEESLIDPPELRALLNPADPMYSTLVNDPFYTVHPSTEQEYRGQAIFERDCMSCHNTPNVFGNMDHIDGAPLSFPPNYGHVFDVGVAQRNALHLDFRRWDAATQTRQPVMLGLATLDGRTIEYTVEDDIGAAFDTGRYEDLHRFKVPQLRRIRLMAPYFHDNSAATLEDVVQFFNSQDYADSGDGRQHPIHETNSERADLVAFLRIL